MLYKPWDPGVSHTAHTHYNPVVDCPYWPVLGTFNNWNIVYFTKKNTSSEEFNDINNVVLDGTSDNIDALVQKGKYGDINKIYMTLIFFYAVKYLSKNFTLQEGTNTYGKASKPDKPTVRPDNNYIHLNNCTSMSGFSVVEDVVYIPRSFSIKKARQ